MNTYTSFLILIALGAAMIAAYDAELLGPHCTRTNIKKTEILPHRINLTMDQGEIQVTKGLDIDYGHAFVDLMLTDPLLARSPLGEEDGGKAHFEKMANDINRAVDEEGKRELLEWAKRTTADSQPDFFFDAMNTLMTKYPASGDAWIAEHIADPADQLDFTVLRNLYWVVFTRVMDMDELCEPMSIEFGGRMRCYLAFADLLGMTE